MEEQTSMLRSPTKSLSEELITLPVVLDKDAEEEVNLLLKDLADFYVTLEMEDKWAKNTEKFVWNLQTAELSRMTDEHLKADQAIRNDT